MSRTFQVIGLTAALSAIGPASADEGNGRNFAIFGHGQDTCGQFIQARFNQQENTAYGIWLAGYITAYNHFSPDTTDLSNLAANHNPEPMAGPLAWIEKYCTDHPMAYFMEAVLEFTKAQHPNRAK